VDIYEKGEMVILATTERAIVIKHDKVYKEAQLLIGDRVIFLPVCHLKKIPPQKNPNMNNCKDYKKPVENT
tara:strand:- start:507 stop:719 length:213 start_codon:yes stop_codon:yes gene_type:complete